MKVAGAFMGLYFLDGDFTGLIARSERAAKQPQFHDHSLQSHRFAEGRKPNFQLDVRTHLSENGIVKGAEFERRIQKWRGACRSLASSWPIRERAVGEDVPGSEDRSA